MKILNPLSFALFLPICSLLAQGTGTDYPYKTLLAEGIQLESYYVKADQSSEIAQTRFERGLYLMSELSALRAKSQFEKADVSIDAYVSRVAGSNLRGVLPWNRKKYKQQLMDNALELRLLLSGQEEDLQALFKEIEKQLAKVDMVSAKRTLERIDELIKALEAKLRSASPEEKPEIEKALQLLRGTKNSILQGIENETDVSDLVESAAKMVDMIVQAELGGSSGNLRDQGTQKPSSSKENSRTSSRFVPGSGKGNAKHDLHLVGSNNVEPELGTNSARLGQNGRRGSLAEQFPQNNSRLGQQEKNGIKYIGQNSGGHSIVQLPDGRKIRVSRPPQDWPNGKATGHDSIYDDRPGGNLIKEEEIVFERSAGPDGYEIKEMENSKTSRKWNFRIKESGGFDDRYSLTNLGGEVDFEVSSWVLRDSSRQVVERLDGNNLHFDPSNLSEGDYSIEVEGVTGWRSPFTVVASVLR
jgi:hypothetical protein